MQISNSKTTQNCFSLLSNQRIDSALFSLYRILNLSQCKYRTAKRCKTASAYWFKVMTINVRAHGLKRHQSHNSHRLHPWDIIFFTLNTESFQVHFSSRLLNSKLQSCALFCCRGQNEARLWTSCDSSGSVRCNGWISVFLPCYQPVPWLGGRSSRRGISWQSPSGKEREKRKRERER